MTFGDSHTQVRAPKIIKKYESLPPGTLPCAMRGFPLYPCGDDAADKVVMLMFTEFGRRVHDNGSGTDHGAAGAAFILGDKVLGGEYSEYPSTKSEDLEQGDLVPNIDFRSIYTTLLEDWMGLDANPLVGGVFEKPKFL